MINRIMEILVPFDVRNYHVQLPDLPEKAAVKSDDEGRTGNHVTDEPKTHVTSVLIDAAKNTYEWPANDVSLSADLTQEEVRALLDNKHTRNLEKARKIKPHINKSASQVEAITGFSSGLVKNHLAILRRFSSK